MCKHAGQLYVGQGRAGSCMKGRASTHASQLLGLPLCFPKWHEEALQKDSTAAHNQGIACSQGVDLEHSRVRQEGSEQVHVIMQGQCIHHIVLLPCKHDKHITLKSSQAP